MNTFMINIGLLIFRVSLSALMLFGHGLGKFQKLLSGNEIKFLDPVGFGAALSFSLVVFAEFFASIFLAVGLFTRFNSLSLVITMAVAVFIAHAEDSFASKEKALLYLVGYILLFLIGSGKYSFQPWLNKRLKSSNKFIKFILG